MLPCCPNIESSWSNREVGTILYLCSWPLGREGSWSSVTGTIAPPSSWYQLKCTLCLCVCVCFLPLLPFTLVYCTFHPGGDMQLKICAICWAPNIALSAWYQTAGDRWWVSSLVTPITGTRQLHSGGFNTIAPDIALYCMFQCQSVHCCTLPRPVPDIRSHRAPAAPTVQPTSPDHRGLVPRLCLQQPPS